MKIIKNLFFVIILMLIFSGCILFEERLDPPPVPTPKPAYYYAAFNGGANPTLFIYTSSDGQNFSLYADTGYTDPYTGVLRDPGLIYLNDKYYIAYTIKSYSYNTTSFAIASSSNLKNWNYLTSVNSSVVNTTRVWAPDWYVEGSTVNLIVNINDATNDIYISHFKPYIFTATDSTMTSWSDPVDMNIGINHIDAFVVKEGGTYHCFTVNGSGSPPYIEHYTAVGLTGPWTFINAPFATHREGPSLIKMNNGTWRIFIDPYNTSGNILKTATSTDLEHWTPESSTGMNAYHGSCIYH